MAVNEDFLQFILDQLQPMGPLETKRMFGGVGFYKEGLMFAMIGYDAFRLKTDDANEKEYIQAGMLPLMVKGELKKMPYFEVPATILEDQEQLLVWANKSYEIAIKHKK